MVGDPGTFRNARDAYLENCVCVSVKIMPKCPRCVCMDNVSITSPHLIKFNFT